MSGGLVGLLARGRRSIIPGALTFSILGFLGDTAYSAFRAKQSVVESANSEERAVASGTGDLAKRDGDQAEENLLQRIARSKWSPMTVVTDEEYRRILLRRKEEISDEIQAVSRSIDELKKEREEQTPQLPDREP